MAAGKAQSEVHRLLDMVVEEVSLVDRAANQHRFLIVKRSEPMDQDTAAAADTTETPPTEGHQDTEPAPPDTDETVVDSTSCRTTTAKVTTAARPASPREPHPRSTWL